MKQPLPLPCLLAMAGLLWIGMGLVSCKPAPDPTPTPSPERAFVLYDIAWRCGQRDNLTPLSHDWQRYRDKLTGFEELPEREKIFRSGYDDGFAQHPEEPLSEALVEYDRAFRRGRVDAWMKKARSAAEAESSAGYEDGFSGKAHAHGRPY